ncbi:MAG: acetyl-CoA carboxylase biotin carboxylase subunit [Acidobacteria bacterium]|nr:acetyl-CoA carboxylase biotin carboxylase subunit [Acidobacteriota bacterium]
MFKKVLIANRGEIAIRVIRCLRELEIESVAVYSDADRDALHVRWANQAVRLPGNTAVETYLQSEKILEAAKRCGAEAIHPGYGFLSEQAGFARRCREEGIAFIGPNPEAIEQMGDKTTARDVMKKAGVPVVPGFQSMDATLAEAKDASAQMGYPVMLKAAAGGGGKGMRMVERAEQFESAFQQARSEAAGAFGDDRVYIEKYLMRPRHIEVQIVSDKHGNHIHLGERECSIQRRHQKVVEEAPSPAVSDDKRAELGAIALMAARAVNYDSVGTVEFLMDQTGACYFLEMNTRLQVEHPVTEWITGLDLVRMQLEIAAGDPLRLDQKDVVIRGHAIECRIYAEDPYHKFRPSPGLITYLGTPTGPGVRDDSGVYQGYEVPIYYDPMISKLSTWGADRNQAIGRMIRALGEYKIGGIAHNIDFHRHLMHHPAFVSADLDTSFIDRYPELTAAAATNGLEHVAVIAASIKHFRERMRQSLATQTSQADTSAWKQSGRLGQGGRSWN